jgi:hypothetical protein
LTFDRWHALNPIENGGTKNSFFKAGRHLLQTGQNTPLDRRAIAFQAGEGGVAFRLPLGCGV